MLNTIAILNRLLGLHSSTLPMYVVNAPPYQGVGDEKAAGVLKDIVEDQQLMVDKIAAFLTKKGGPVIMGEFPMEFTDMHDLSMDYIISNVLVRQRNEVQAIEELSSQLHGDPQAKALSQEALGAAKAHVQSLDELSEVV